MIAGGLRGGGSSADCDRTVVSLQQMLAYMPVRLHQSSLQVFLTSAPAHNMCKYLGNAGRTAFDVTNMYGIAATEVRKA